MAELPTGTVTFLFTDIEGSTALLREHPGAYPAALLRHHDLLRSAVDAHGGHVFDTGGDAVYAVFRRPTDAVAAAVEGQFALLREPWRETSPIRVRIGVHTGEAERQGNQYVGMVLHRCARLMATAHGGQIVLSGVTAELVQDALPPGATVADLGAHRLKDLARPEHIFQVAHPDLPADFPPLRSLDARPHNLPVASNRFVGRERELAAVAERLRQPDVRLLTLTGPGGTGKTRLALHAAADLLDEFPDGVWLVLLAPVADPTLVIAAMAQVLGVQDSAGRSLVEGVKGYLRTRRLLLVLDNFEHLAAAAPLVGDLLAACPDLKVLVTSRVVLHLAAEHDFAVPPLALPDGRDGLDPTSAAGGSPAARLSQLRQYDAVRLFVERAQAARADFAVSDENAPAVAEICARLDGLPLAIELAAARIKVLPPQALLNRLSHRLQVLTGGPRDAPARQQTLRQTIDWSYNLLAPAEQVLLRRLAVFVGGCSLEAAEAVCGDFGLPPKSKMDVLDGLASLVDQSLLRQEESVGGEARFWMLETVREYALERLEAVGEPDTLRRRHAAYFLTLAEQAEPLLRGPLQVPWLERLDQELGNLRATLQWALDQGEIELALRLAGALWTFWVQRGHQTEGRGWLTAALARRNDAPAAVQAKALLAAGHLVRLQGDLAAGRELLEESVARLREVGDQWALGLALTQLETALLAQGDRVRARALGEESVACFRAVGDRWGLGVALFGLAAVVNEAGATEEARPLYEESIALLRVVGDQWYLAVALSWAGDLALVEKDYAAASARFEEGLAAARAFRNPRATAPNLAGLGAMALYQDDAAGAAVLFREQLALVWEVRQRRAVWLGLTGLAGASGAQGQMARAARLLGAADALRDAVGFALDPAERALHDRAAAGAPGDQDEEAFARAYPQGRAMSLEQAVAYALEDASEDRQQPSTAA